MAKLIIIIPIFLTVFNLCSCKNEANQNTQINAGKGAEQIHAAFYNNTGSKIALSSSSGKLYITDDTFKLLHSIQAHTGNANSCFFSLDDQHVITGGKDKLLKIWSANDLASERVYDFKFNSYTSVYGYNTLGGCGENGKTVIYNLKTRDTLNIDLEKDGAYHLYYLEPDSALVISSGLTGYEIDLIHRRIVHRYSGHEGQVYCIMPSHTRKLVVTASADSILRIFDRNNEKLLHHSISLDGQLFVATFDPTDNVVAASTSSGSIYFLDGTLSHIIMKIPAFKGRINTIHFSPDGTRILAGSEGGGAKIFSTSDGKLLYEFKY